jgi:transcriptional regulator with XRE-family HTH domain
VSFAEAITILAAEAGMTKYELAVRSGIPKQQMSQLMGGAQPRWRTVRLLATALGVQPSVIHELQGVPEYRPKS